MRAKYTWAAEGFRPRRIARPERHSQSLGSSTTTVPKSELHNVVSNLRDKRARPTKQRHIAHSYAFAFDTNTRTHQLHNLMYPPTPVPPCSK